MKTVIFTFALFLITSANAAPKYTPIKVTAPVVTGKTFKNAYLNLDGKSNLLFVECVFEDCGQIRGENAHHVKFVRCKFSGLSADNHIYVELYPGNDYWLFDGCEFWNTPNAIYTRIADGKAANFLSVLRCYFHDIGIGKYAVKKDGHSIGIQGGVGHQIAWNKIRNVGGTAICAWAPKNQPLTFINFYENDIDGVRKNPGASGSGIEISSSYDVAANLPPPGWRIGHLLIRNKIRNCDGNGFRYACARDPLAIDEGNTYSNCKAGNVYIKNPFENN